MQDQDETIGFTDALRLVADLLDANPQIPQPSGHTLTLNYFYDRDKWVDAARALGATAVTDTDVYVRAERYFGDQFRLAVAVSRSLLMDEQPKPPVDIDALTAEIAAAPVPA